MNLNFRISNKDDWQTVQRLSTELYENSSQFDEHMKKGDTLSTESIKDFKDDVSNESKFCMIAELDNSAVGYIVGVEHNYSWRLNRRGEISHMGVSPSVRSLGIGSSLVTEFKKWCLDRGITHIATTAYFNDAKARNFYEKQGMNPIDVGYEAKIIL